MTYEMRTRNKRVNYDERAYFSASSEEEKYEYDSTHSDPDFTRPRSQGDSRAHINMNSSGADQLQQNSGESSSRNVVRRRRRRPSQVRRRSTNQGPNRRREEPSQTSAPTPELETNNGAIPSRMEDKSNHEKREEAANVDSNVRDGETHKGGVVCPCCDRVLDVYKLKDHVYSHLSKPCEDMSTEKLGDLIMKWLTSDWDIKDEDVRCGFFDVEKLRTDAADKSDDTCMICANGGTLMCCETCPTTIHHECMGMKNIPQEAWFCNYCVCRYCGIADQELHSCSQCEKKFHQDCLLNKNIVVLRRERKNSFCGATCAKIFKKLENLVGVNIELDNEFSWTLLRYKSLEFIRNSNDKLKWITCNRKIDKACTIMDQSFCRNIDRHTKIEVLQRVLYSGGSNLMRINFDRFYTAVLEKDSKIISVATIRIHGARMAEMPFVATRAKYRRQGMLQRLLSAIESTLSQLKVENLVIPSVQEANEMWTDRYGFSEVKYDLKNELRFYNTLMFPGALRLYKSLVEAEPSNAVLVEESGAANNPSDANQRENIMNPDIISGKILPFDLNLEPPQDDDDMA